MDINEFLSQCCTISDTSRIRSTDLYSAYCDWMAPIKPVSMKTFTRAVNNLYRDTSVAYGIHRIAGKSARGFIGLKVSPAAPGDKVCPSCGQKVGGPNKD